MLCVYWVPMLAFRRYLNLPKIDLLAGLLRLAQGAALLVDQHAQLGRAAGDLDGLGVTLRALALGLDLVEGLAVAPVVQVEPGPAELVDEVGVGAPAVGAHRRAGGARTVDAVGHDLAARVADGEDDAALLVDHGLVGGHPARPRLALEDDLLADLAGAVLADHRPAGLLGALQARAWADGTGDERDGHGRLMARGRRGCGRRRGCGLHGRHDAGGRHEQRSRSRRSSCGWTACVFLHSVGSWA